MTYYLKYRSQTLEDLDSELVRENLKKIVSSGDIPHAFLFYGPRGTGKTSAARILAKTINCENRKNKSIEPCNKCESCISITRGSNMDVVEIDAASHRGIDDIRSLREAVRLSPAKAKKKVYIIDEVHMLTLEASNALLKTLEEPPDHVVFILATTNPEKLIDTIKSRTVEIGFKKATPAEIRRSLQRIAFGEKIKISNEAANIIAKVSRGSFRDSHKLLEQLVTSKVNLEKVNEIEKVLVGFQPVEIQKLVGFIVDNDLNASIAEIEAAHEKGVSSQTYLESLVEVLHSSLLSKAGLGEDPIPQFSLDDLVVFFELLNKARLGMRDSIIEQVPLESAVIQFIERRKSKNGDPVLKENTFTKKNEDIKNINIPTQDATKDLKFKDGVKLDKSNENNAIFVREIDDNLWGSLLKAIKPKNSSTEALLRAAKPIGFDGKVLQLGVYYSFHKERLEETLHSRIVESTAEEVIGTPIRISCMLTDPPIRNNNSSQSISGVSGATIDDNSNTLTEVEDENIIKLAKEVFENN